MDIGFEQYIGLDEQHVCSFTSIDNSREFKANQDAIKALRALQDKAKAEGFTLEVCSAFRSFEHQARLFGAKFLGQRPILDRNEQVISNPPADPIERMRAILIFSAMPGFSRHHFGTDFDIYAPNCLPSGQSLQLTYHEYLEGSYFYEFGLFLQENLAQFDFANPYSVREGKSSLEVVVNHANSCTQDGQASSNAQDNQVGLVQSAHITSSTNNFMPQVGFEPWHISYLPAARRFLEVYESERVLDYVSKQDLPYAAFVKEVMTTEQINAMLRFDI